jgi:rhodanese-related sulfurtransferase
MRMRQEYTRPKAPPEDGEVNPLAVKEMLERGTIQLVDVREAFARDLVRIAGAVHISSAEIQTRMAELHAEHPVVCHCEEGERSRRTAQALRGEGFDAYYMAGGIRAWIENELPVERTGSS